MLLSNPNNIFHPMNEAAAFPSAPPAPDANPDAEPDYLTPLDAYAGQALNGMLAAGAYPHEATALAAKSFVLAGAMVRERTRYFEQHPVGVPVPTGTPTDIE